MSPGETTIRTRCRRCRNPTAGRWPEPHRSSRWISRRSLTRAACDPTTRIAIRRPVLSGHADARHEHARRRHAAVLRGDRLRDARGGRRRRIGGGEVASGPRSRRSSTSSSRRRTGSCCSTTGSPTRCCSGWSGGPAHPGDSRRPREGRPEAPRNGHDDDRRRHGRARSF